MNLPTIPKEIFRYPYTFSLFFLSITVLMGYYFWLTTGTTRAVIGILISSILLLFNFIHWVKLFNKLFQRQLDLLNIERRGKEEKILKKLAEELKKAKSEEEKEKAISAYNVKFDEIQREYRNKFKKEILGKHPILK